MRRATELERHLCAGALAPRPVAARSRRHRRRRARVRPRARDRSARRVGAGRAGARVPAATRRTRPRPTCSSARSPTPRRSLRDAAARHGLPPSRPHRGSGVRARRRRVRGTGVAGSRGPTRCCSSAAGFAVRLKDATQYFVAGRMDEAMALLQQLRREKPDDIALLNHLGEVYVAAGKLDEGVGDARTGRGQRSRALRSPRQPRVRVPETGRSRDARAPRSIARSPSTRRSAARMKRRDSILWRAGDEAGAVDAFKTALRWDPRNVRALVWAGMVEMNRNRPREALEQLRRARRASTRRASRRGSASPTRRWRSANGTGRPRRCSTPPSSIPTRPDVKQAAEHLRSLRR